ncbi:MAG: hypothetical protein GWN67_26475 [Phycisphaerae bacterium]|nr:ankyrin repeat domain-containing protein [Phycisphaerae bacterium]NIP52162.1 ankyrin repeat domain-containing protein [Phycisphaerae bacterium]NIS51167.1 ankyrin repeat domain-containing protein [Phycisphaerae bacterium]NIU08837.1 ankyrin repeat domain-containing protein [Phycisphaerae bacterium]NIU59792.1 hypothetical protein [Phycisphaerae bacterium]
MIKPLSQRNIVGQLLHSYSKQKFLAFVLMASAMVLFSVTVFSGGKLLGLLFLHVILGFASILLLAKTEKKEAAPVSRKRMVARTWSFRLMLLSFILITPSYVMPHELSVLLFTGLIAGIISLALIIVFRCSVLSIVFVLMPIGVLLYIWSDAYAQKRARIFWIAIVHGEVEHVRELLHEGYSAGDRCGLGTTLTAAFRFGGNHRGVYYRRSNAQELPAHEKEAVILKMLLTLIDSGADVNEKDDNGWTPLLKAIQRNQVRAVEMLIEKGADVNEPLDEVIRKRSPLKLAIDMEHKEIAKLLRTNGAKEFP